MLLSLKLHFRQTNRHFLIHPVKFSLHFFVLLTWNIIGTKLMFIFNTEDIMRNFKKFGFYLMKLIISSFAVYITGWLMSSVHIGYPAYINSLLIAFVLLLLNKFLKPVLVFLTIPVTFLTFGLFLFIINALIILVASEFVDSFSVDGFWSALFFSIILSIITSLLESIGRIKVVTYKSNQ